MVQLVVVVVALLVLAADGIVVAATGTAVPLKLFYIWDEEVPANHVAGQDPAPYTVVKKGRRVRVVLSRGPQLYPVPDVRNTSTTQARLRIQQQGFRDDLFYRLNEITLFLPPLRERPEDIPLLVNHFIGKYNAAYGKDVAQLSPDVTSQLIAFSWPES